MKKKEIQSIAIQAAVTAAVIAVVNKIMNPVVQGLGAGERLLLNNFSLDRMAQFADMITMTNVNNKEFLERAFNGIDINDPNFYKNGNKTTIGNCAFVALNTKYPQYKEKATVLLNNYKKHANGEL